MTEPQQSLYERLGGPGIVSAAVNLFYSRILIDPSLHDFFADVPMNEQVEKQTRFLIRAFGGPTLGQTRSLRDVHQRVRAQGMTEAHFDAVVGHLVATLQELRVHHDLIEEVIARVESTRDDVLGR